MVNYRFPSLRVVQLLALVGASLVLVAVAMARVAHAGTLVVDDDGLATATDCEGHGSAFGTIQAAINAAVASDTVQICPGTYDEQLKVTTIGLTIRGSGAGLTIIRPDTVDPIATNIFGNEVSPIILVEGAPSVTIASVTIDGSRADSGAILIPQCPILPFFAGIYWKNSSGTLDTSNVTGIKSATACTFAVRAEGAIVGVSRSMFEAYGFAAISCVGQSTKCSIQNNAIRGQGPVANQIQTGIQIRSQAAGAISGNAISDHFLLGVHGVPQSSVGIFLVNAQPSSNPHLVRDNVFSNNQVNIQRISTAAAF